MKLQIDQYKSLLALSRSGSFVAGSFELFINQAIVTLSSDLGVSRASFWTYNKEKELIQNELLFDRNTNHFSSGDILTKKDFPKYFEAFQNELCVLADDASIDPRTKEFKEDYLDVHDIKSMLDVQVSVEGQLFGIICLEHTGQKRKWHKSEELYATSVASYIAQSYITKLKNEEELKRKQSETNYQRLFFDSPIPMWVHDDENYRFLDVNNAAIENYGYSKEEFLSMQIFDIRSAKDSDELMHFLMTAGRKKWHSQEWKHQLKNGKEITVESSSGWTTYMGRDARIVMALDVTKEKKLTSDKEESLNKFKDFAFYAAHDIRGPVVRLLGLNKMLEIERKKNESSENTLGYIHDTIEEVDKTLLKLNSMLEQIIKEQISDTSRIQKLTVH